MPAPKGNKNAVGNKGGGRPTLYDPKYARQARMICGLLGATDPQLAGIFGVSLETIQLWRKAHVEFDCALKNGKDLADAKVVQSLYRRACGYSHKAVKIMQYEGTPVQVDYIERYPPDTVACIFWLKNRQRESWRDKQPDEGGTDVGDGLKELAAAIRDSPHE